jgi:hypothetical protein
MMTINIEDADVTEISAILLKNNHFGHRTDRFTLNGAL